MNQLNVAIERELGRLLLQLCIKEALVEDQRAEIETLKAALKALEKKEEKPDA